MLTRPYLARRAFTATRRRHYSEAASEIPNHHSKVRGRPFPMHCSDTALTLVFSAIPFAFSAEDAISHIGVAASVAGYVGRSNKGQPNVPFTSLVASILAKYFPMSGFKPLQPTRIQPLYFPTWFVRAELEATAWLSPDSDTEGSQVCHIPPLHV